MKSMVFDLFDSDGDGLISVEVRLPRHRVLKFYRANGCWRFHILFFIIFSFFFLSHTFSCIFRDITEFPRRLRTYKHLVWDSCFQNKLHTLVL